MRSALKKFVAVLLCMTMVFSSTLPHFASGDLINKEDTSATHEELNESVEEKTDSTDFSESKNEDDLDESLDENSVSEEELESDDLESSEIESSEIEPSEIESGEIESGEIESGES